MYLLQEAAVRRNARMHDSHLLGQDWDIDNESDVGNQAGRPRQACQHSFSVQLFVHESRCFAVFDHGAFLVQVPQHQRSRSLWWRGHHSILQQEALWA